MVFCIGLIGIVGFVGYKQIKTFKNVGVIDNDGIRTLSIREGLRLFGYPDSYSLDMFNNSKKEINEAFDLLGNTVVISAVTEVIKRVADVYDKDQNKDIN